MPRGTRYTVLDTVTVEYHRESIVKPIELKAVHVKVRSKQLTDLKGRPIRFTDLKGFVLAKRLR